MRWWWWGVVIRYISDGGEGRGGVKEAKFL